MTSPRPARTARSLALGLALGAGACAPAAAQALPTFVGFAPTSSLAWPRAAGDGTGRDGDGRWTGSYATLATGFEVVSSKRFGGYAGPTLGVEGGRIWQEGSLLYGIVGGFNHLSVLGGGASPGFGGLALSRDFAGAVQVQVGTLLTPDVLLYAKAGALGAHETLRVGPTALAPPLSRADVVVRPDARVGVEWALGDGVSLAVEAGVIGPAFR